MATDTRQKRMAGVMFGCPRRGALVDATEFGFQVQNRAAAVFSYAIYSTARPYSLTMNWGARLKHLTTDFDARLKHLCKFGTTAQG